MKKPKYGSSGINNNKSNVVGVFDQENDVEFNKNLSLNVTQNGTECDDDARGGDSEDDRDERLPVSDEAKMEGHRKVVSALALEHTGSRLLTGSHDYTVRMYDSRQFTAGPFALFRVPGVSVPTRVASQVLAAL